MGSASEQSSAQTDHDLLKRKQEVNQASLGTEAQPQSPAAVLRYLQRTAGNRAVNVLLQRLGGGQGSSGGLKDVAGEEQLGLPMPEPVTMPLDTSNYGPGDYNPPPDNGTAMAKHVQRWSIQRDDSDPPPNSASAQSGATLAGPKQAPYSIQVTRTLKLLPPYKIDALHLDLFGDTQVSVGLDSQGTLSAQLAQNLLTLHFFPNWRVPIDTTLAAIYQQNILPKLVPQPGAQVQAEGKVSKTFSLTLTLTGVRTDSDDGKSRVWSVTGAAGIIKYF